MACIDKALTCETFASVRPFHPREARSDTPCVKAVGGCGGLVNRKRWKHIVHAVASKILQEDDLFAKTSDYVIPSLVTCRLFRHEFSAVLVVPVTETWENS